MSDMNRSGDEGRLADFSSRISPRSPGEALRPERPPPPPPRSQQARHPAVVFMNFLLTVVVVALLGAAGMVAFGKLRFEQAAHFREPRTFVVERGMGLRDIAEQLQKSGLITSKWIFIAGVRANGAQDELKAGEYLIPARASMEEIMETMVSGKAILYSITIPEGLTTQQIIARIQSDPVLTGAIEQVPDEGTLLPDTYRFSRGDTRQNLINRMRRDHDRVVTEIWNRREDGLPITDQKQFVTLASIVEKETGIADERSRVAAVFINRLRRNMRLQSDPTVIYGVYGGAGKPSDTPVRRSDLDDDNAYNTYKVTGLPPGPIANPGRASLEAVANPSRTKDLYFVADGTGGHVFAETLADHNRNVQRWRQVEAKRREQGDDDQAQAEAAEEPAEP
ncbi:endolytic transglycosylase MltG [Prosthecomicrobium pneumaticum]|uniref:Endolytic murein transglycosylase n=1 Tax=Prosthecomicrobium pneumaticum TaxID=81895 RepID=A0A7W9CT93_9HYPH|nr:endolytic transglycosylase MltG [Prosthecomicrobium pneumaticum]MBB5751490.1 UPF0755 protein [Prosthecomicrobium pneumaticum]